MKTCSNCGYKNDENDSKCINCGSPLPLGSKERKSEWAHLKYTEQPLASFDKVFKEHNSEDIWERLNGIETKVSRTYRIALIFFIGALLSAVVTAIQWIIMINEIRLLISELL
jgi:hypothetical protein